jgi:hypothetical protein
MCVVVSAAKITAHMVSAPGLQGGHVDAKEHQEAAPSWGRSAACSDGAPRIYALEGESAGDAFLRSAYMLAHFGDSISGGSKPPFIQLLPTLDAEKAHAKFVRTASGVSVSSTSAASGSGS